MNRQIDIDSIVTPIAGDNPSGEDLRYTPVYDNIKEARREDDLLDTTIPAKDIKRADWNGAIDLCLDALTNKTKDLQIAAWLTEALTKTEGFEGLNAGLRICTVFLSELWDSVYPQIEDDDLDFRAAPLVFMNDKLPLVIKQVPLTDPKDTAGHSWFNWQEAHQVGYEASTRNQYGDVDENKKQQRDELIAEGKLVPEDFDIAAERTSKDYYKSMAEILAKCREEFSVLDKTVDEKFGANPPMISDIIKAIEDCERFTAGMLEKKLESDPDPEPLPQVEETEETQIEDGAEASAVPPSAATPAGSHFPAVQTAVASEDVIWTEALKLLKTGGIKMALDRLYNASNSAASIREQNRYRLLMAKLCLKADRPDLARPIMEQLYALIEELQLVRWESPMWIAEVFETLYQCLTAGSPSDDDIGRAQELFKRMSTMDVTKAMMYKI